MMKLIVAPLAALCLSLAGFAADAQAKAPTRDEREIAAMMDRLEVAINAKDIDGVMNAYLPDESLFLFDMIPPRQYVGAVAMRKHWENDFFAKADGPLQYTVTDLSITADGPLAYSHSIQRLTCMGTNGRPVDITMRFSDVYRKIKGRWYIVMEHVSVPVDPATGQPDFSSKP